ncbi:MAG: hydroxymethylglutaryl-CoA lyase [Antricoccus sp.]
MAEQLAIVEVSPRDGLQNEKTLLSTGAKLDLIEQLIEAGARRIEAVSFVHPRLVPAMADAEAIMEGVPRRDDVSYIGLVLNPRGWSRARLAGVDEINVVACASETFSEKNQNSTIEGIISDAEEVLADAASNGMPTSLTITVAFGCPFEGEVDPDVVIDLARRGAAAGAQERAIGDTVGVGVPTQVTRLFDGIRDEVGPDVRLRGHFHNTRNTGYANAAAALAAGVRVLDASAAGIGGCPFAPKATGNIATEDLLYMAHRMGFETGIDLEKYFPIADYLAGQLNHDVAGQLSKAGNFPRRL